MKVNDIVFTLKLVRLRAQAAIHGATWLTTGDLALQQAQRKGQ